MTDRAKRKSRNALFSHAKVQLGVDENGLGPRLGPLVVTAVAAETDEAGARAIETRPRGGMARRLDDSKKLVAYGDSALGEAWARSLAARAGLTASTPEALLAALALDAETALRAPCPGDHARQCWGAEREAFVADDALVAQIDGDLARLASRGIDVRRVRIGIVCTKRLNEAAARGLSRFDVDLHTMERLVLAARAEAGEEVLATCGKVGGFDRYAPHFGPLAGYLHTPLVEGRAVSAYRVLGVGTLAFVRDADASNLLVSMASLVGKWARDLLMRRIVRYHQDATPDAPDASGYHDPVTTRFIALTARSRAERALDDACFVRRTAARDDASA